MTDVSRRADLAICPRREPCLRPPDAAIFGRERDAPETDEVASGGAARMVRAIPFES